MTGRPGRRSAARCSRPRPAVPGEALPLIRAPPPGLLSGPAGRHTRAVVDVLHPVAVIRRRRELPNECVELPGVGVLNLHGVRGGAADREGKQGQGERYAEGEGTAAGNLTRCRY